MTDSTQRRITRRTIARGAAGSVPVVAVGAAAPAHAASHTVEVTTVSQCISSRYAYFTITATGLPSGSAIMIQIDPADTTALSLDGTITDGGTEGLFVLTSTGGASTTGQIRVDESFTTGQGTQVVTAEVMGSTSVDVTGDLTASVTFTRSGTHGCATPWSGRRLPVARRVVADVTRRPSP